MWELTTSPGELITRGSVIFISLFIMFKIWGKKHLGEMTAFDFIILLIMSEAVQNSLVDGDKSIPGGLVIVATFMILTSIMNILSFYSRKAEKLLDGSPQIVILNGKMIDQVLKKERITQAELEESVREQGIAKIEDVGLGILEANGKISMIKAEDLH